MQMQVDYALELKTGFRYDPFMLHQANVRFFSYNDPVTHTTRSVSLATLWLERVLKQTASFYQLPSTIYLLMKFYRAYQFVL